jgi:hypothetical protein
MQRFSEPGAMQEVLSVPPAAELEGFVDNLLKTLFSWLHPVLPPNLAYHTVFPHRLTSNSEIPIGGPG